MSYLQCLLMREAAPLGIRTMAPKFSTTAVKPLSVTWLATGVTAFFHIQLLTVSAEPSASATSVYPPSAELNWVD
tara:strand:- start:76 stop:300 length:225 start_codon:yes stop_codon:yes gene_type:complete